MKFSRPSSAWLVLVCGQAAAGEAIEREGRDAHGVEGALPQLDVGPHAAGAVHQHHHRQPALALRDAELARGDRRLGLGVAVEELLVGQRQRVDVVRFRFAPR